MTFRSVRSLALVLCLGSLSPACSKSDDAPPPRPAGTPLAVPRDGSLSRVDSLDAFQLEYARAYRLKPDARFSLALSTLEPLLTGKPGAPVESRFQDGQWTFVSQGQTLGTLPEFPTQAQALALLEARVRALGTQGLALQTEEAPAAAAPPAGKPPKGKRQKLSKAVSSKVASSKSGSRKVRGAKKAPAADVAPASAPLPLGRETLTVLHTLDQDWATGQRSARRVKEGARALAALSFQLVDLTGVADAVSARALAQLALARVLTGEPLVEEQLLLASSLGHEREARELARTLPEGNLLRLYALGDDAALEQHLRSEREPGLARALWVRRLPEVGTSERARRLESLKAGPLPTLLELSTRMRVRDFDVDEALGTMTPLLLLSEVASSAGHPDQDERLSGKPSADKRRQALERKFKRLIARFNLDAQGLLPTFERELERVGTPEGFFLDAETERLWFQGLFYTSQYRLGLHLLDARAWADGAASWTTNRLGTPTSETGTEFQGWMNQLIAARRGQPLDAALMKSFTELKHFGAAPLVRVFEELENTADWGDPAMSQLTRRLAARMDSRPDHRASLGSLVRESLFDPVLSEKLLRAAHEATQAPRLGEWLAWLERDDTKLLALLDAPPDEVRGTVRLRALEHLVTLGKVPPAALMDRLRPVLATSGDDWGFIDQGVRLLERKGRSAEARALLEPWLAAREDSKAFELVFARTALARVYQAEGNAAAGWAALQPALESGQLDALGRGALLAQALGDEARARALIAQAVERYPGPKSLSLQAEVLWRAGQPEEAAEALAQPKRTVRLADWRWRVGERYAAVFATRPPEAKKAFQALRKQKLGPLELGELAVEVNKAGNPALAFALQSQLKAPGLQQLELLMRAFAYKKAATSEPAAREWLRASVPERMREPLCMFAFSEGEDGVLWDVVPEADGQDENSDYVWLTRAAASVRAHDTDAAHQQALAQRFAEDRPGFYHQLGRHLLGLSSQEAVAAVTGLKNRLELPFFLGLKAQAEGRQEDAVGWYRNAVETSNPSNGEYRWALAELIRLTQAERSLTRPPAP